ncbi:hypothetical protein [Albirhodobacter sp. R86504]|uniref:hypothetical protein n=1 Tax=Albirhodobacter sp. R86504 TaxID=3093848 RepID=UPI00366BB101
MPVKSEVIAEDDGYGIYAHRHRRQRRTLVITFDGIKSGIAQKGFGTEWSLKQGYDTIFVAQQRLSQYQLLSREQFTESVAKVCSAYDRVVCYGASLGGYAALYFGGSISARIVAASPRLSNHPAFPHNRYSNIDFFHERELPEPLSSQPPVIIFDPLHLRDSRFVFQYVGPRYKDMHLLTLPGVGHLPLGAMAQAGLLSRFMPNLITGKINALPKWAVSSIRGIDDRLLETSTESSL